MKAILRLPTKQQYAYIEAEVEGTEKEIVEQYFKLGNEYWKQQARHDREKADQIPFKGDEFNSNKK